MSPRPNRPEESASIHERARLLASAAVDETLEPSEAEWLDLHLAGCADCAAVAAEHAALHRELRSLEAPEVPRDLWARTAAALDSLEPGTGTRSRGATRRASNRPLVGTAIAVATVVLVAGASLLAQGPIPAGSGARTSGGVAAASGGGSGTGSGSEGPLAVVNGTSYWITGADGVYQIKGSSTDCSRTSGSCDVSGSGQTLGSIQSDSAVSAVLAPDASQAAVWTSDKIAVVPLAAAPQTVALDLLTPRPTAAATAAATAGATATATTAAAATASATATHSASPTVSAATSPASGPSPAASASAAVLSSPVAILEGYEIVGGDPEFSADGSFLAFAARPVDHSTGSDVFVWRAGQDRARAVTFRHSDRFAGWFGGRLLISEILAASGSAGTVATTSFVYDPVSDAALRFGRAMIVAGVDPTGEFVVYWSGAPEFDTATGLWQPGKGDLWFDRLGNVGLEPASLAAIPAGSPSPAAPSGAAPTSVASASVSASASPALAASAPTAAASTSAGPTRTAGESPAAGPLPQVLSMAAGRAAVRRWSVHWAPSGRELVVWVADPGSVKIGRLSLLSVDTAGQLTPTLAAEGVLWSVCIDDGHVVFTSALDGKTYMKPLSGNPEPSAGASASAGGSAGAAAKSGPPTVAVSPAPSTLAPVGSVRPGA